MGGLVGWAIFQYCHAVMYLSSLCGQRSIFSLVPSAWSEEIHVRYDPVLPCFSVFCGMVVFDGFGDIRKSLQQEKGYKYEHFFGHA